MAVKNSLGLNTNSGDRIAREKATMAAVVADKNSAQRGLIASEKGGAPRTNGDKRRAVGQNRTLRFPK